MKRLFVAPIVLALLAVSSNAYAVGPYTYFYYDCNDVALKPPVYTQVSDRTQAVKWSGTSFTIRFNSTDFPTSGANLFRRNALNGAIAEWNEAPHAFTISVGSNTTGRSVGNGVTEAYSDSGTSICGGAPACTPFRGSCGSGITEADVVFRADWPFADTTVKTNLQPYGGANRDMRGVFIHELGHAIGLGHNSIYFNIMGDDIDHHITQGASTANFVGGYGARAAALFYGYRSGAREELTVSHWRRSGTLGGGYSDHTPSRLYDANNNLIRTVTSCNGVGGMFYPVSRGQTVKPGFAFENEGANPQSNVGVKFYLSKDDTIGPPDQSFASTTVNISRGPADNVVNSTTLESGESKIPVVIPNTTSTGATLSGAFFIGVHLDPSNAIPEVDDDPFGNAVPPYFTGNSAYLQQRVCIGA